MVERAIKKAITATKKIEKEVDVKRPTKKQIFDLIIHIRQISYYFEDAKRIGANQVREFLTEVDRVIHERR